MRSEMRVLALWVGVWAAAVGAAGPVAGGRKLAVAPAPAPTVDRGTLVVAPEAPSAVSGGALVVAPAPAPVVGGGTLVVAPVVDGGKLAVDVTMGGARRHLVTALGGEAWRRGMRGVYDALDEGGYDAAALDPELERLGAALFGRLDAELAGCGEVQFVVPAGELRQPLDLLHWRGRPLYLARAVGYAVGSAVGAGGAPEKPGRWATAVLVSDATADPEDGVGACRKYWARVTYAKAGGVTRKRLRRMRGDVLLVSAHGSVGDADRDTIAAGGGGRDTIGLAEDLEGRDFAAVGARLVYLDSCGLGVSGAFLEALRAKGTQWYLAPIVSNEAGDSSTATMKGFFAELGARGPVGALFETRKKLAQTYAGAGKDLLWKVFPFRCYRLR